MHTNQTELISSQGHRIQDQSQDIPQFIYSPIKGHLGCFHVLAVMNKADIIFK